VVFPLVTWVKRVTFMIDPEGYIAARFHHELMFEKHVDDAIAFLKALRKGT
jgi:peroxiredoxin